MNKFKESKSKILEKLGVDNSKLEELVIDIPYNDIFPEIKDEYTFFTKVFKELGGELFECKSLADCTQLIEKQITKHNYTNVYNFVPDLTGILKNIAKEYKNEDIDFEKTECVITNCELLVSRTGSIVISSHSQAGRKFNIIPDTHIVIAYRKQLISDIEDALNYMEEKYHDTLPSMISLIAGPSRTADIEKTLVMGAHGPKEILLFLIQ